MSAVPSGREGVVEEDVDLLRDGLVLRGMLARPQSGNPNAGVVTLHGWAGPRTGPQRLFVTLGRELAAQGLPALRIDLAGRGQSDGETETATLDSMIADASAAIDWFAGRGQPHVGLVGICSGGNVAIGAATLRPEAVFGLSCISTLPFAPPTPARTRRKTLQMLGRYARKAARPSTWARLVRGEVDVRGVGGVLADAAGEAPADRSKKDSARDIMAAFASWRRPVQFVHGGADPEAAPARAHYEAFCREHGVPATFRTIEGANHNYYSIPWTTELIETVAAAIVAAHRIPVD